MLEIKQSNSSELKQELYEVVRNAPNVTEVQWIEPDKYGFSRTLSFNVNNQYYTIVWSWNESSLYFSEGSMFRFDRCRISGSWPNSFKNNLVFELDGRTIGIIPIERY